MGGKGSKQGQQQAAGVRGTAVVCFGVGAGVEGVEDNTLGHCTSLQHGGH
jgi:hypothetical protein